MNVELNTQRLYVHEFPKRNSYHNPEPICLPLNQTGIKPELLRISAKSTDRLYDIPC